MGFLFGGSGENKTTNYTTQNTNTSTNYPDWYNQYTQSVLGKAGRAAETEYQPYDVSKMFADFTPDQLAAFQKVRDNQGTAQPYFDQAKGVLNRVGGAGYDPLKNAQPYLDRAGNAINPWEAGAAGTQSAAEGWLGHRDAYMNDYSGALNRANELTERRFSEKTMPGINAQFAMGEGAMGRSNYQKVGGRAVRDLANEMSGNADTMMNQAYKDAAAIYGTDKAREMQAAGQLGTLAASTIQGDTNLANTTANITSGAVSTGLGVSNAYANQGGALSNINLQNATALGQIGNVQQQQNQRPLTAQYQQAQEAKQWPFEMVNFMNAAQRGLQIPQTGTSNTSGQQWQGQSSGSSPSVAGQIAGGASVLQGLGVFDAVGDWWNTPSSSSPSQGASLPNDPGMGNTVFNNGQYSVTGFGDGFNTQGAARGGRIRPRYQRRYANGGPVGALSRRNFSVGGDVPVMRGVNSRSNAMAGGLPPPPPMPPMPLPGGLSAMPPALPPPIGALGGLETMP